MSETRKTPGGSVPEVEALRAFAARDQEVIMALIDERDAARARRAQWKATAKRLWRHSRNWRANFRSVGASNAEMTRRAQQAEARLSEAERLLREPLEAAKASGYSENGWCSCIPEIRLPDVTYPARTCWECRVRAFLPSKPPEGR